MYKYKFLNLQKNNIAECMGQLNYYGKRGYKLQSYQYIDTPAVMYVQIILIKKLKQYH